MTSPQPGPDPRFDALESRVEKLEEYQGQVLPFVQAATRMAVGALHGDVRAVQQEVSRNGQRLDQVAAEVSTVARSQIEHGAALAGLAGKVDGLERKVDGLERKVDGLEGKVDGLEGKVDAQADVLVSVAAQVDAQADVLASVAAQVDVLASVAAQVGPQGETLAAHGQALGSLERKVDSHGEMLTEILRRLPEAPE